MRTLLAIVALACLVSACGKKAPLRPPGSQPPAADVVSHGAR